MLEQENTESQKYVEIGIDAEDYYRIKDKVYEYFCADISEISINQ